MRLVAEIRRTDNQYQRNLFVVSVQVDLAKRLAWEWRNLLVLPLGMQGRGASLTITDCALSQASWNPITFITTSPSGGHAIVLLFCTFSPNGTISIGFPDEFSSRCCARVSIKLLLHKACFTASKDVHESTWVNAAMSCWLIGSLNAANASSLLQVPAICRYFDNEEKLKPLAESHQVLWAHLPESTSPVRIQSAKAHYPQRISQLLVQRKVFWSSPTGHFTWRIFIVNRRHIIVRRV